MTVKLMYLAKRKPGFTPLQFSARWRKHGGLAMSLSLWEGMTRYAQADVLHPSPIPGTSEEYDGVGELWASSAGMWTNPKPGIMDDVNTMLEDEKHTFAHHIPENSMLAEPDIRRDTGDGRTTLFLYFINVDQARKVTDSLASTLDDKIEGIVLNVATTIAVFSEPVLPYRAIIELRARDSDKLAASIKAKGLGAVKEADLAVVAQKAILFG